MLDGLVGCIVDCELDHLVDEAEPLSPGQLIAVEDEA
jgi:hypothetical protein